MKRNFLYLAVGALALSACTSENVLEDAAKERNVIGFENVINKHSRADLDNNTLSTFYVYGYYTLVEDPTTDVTVFDATKVTKTSGSWAYTTEKRYWLPGYTYNFYAYSIGTDELASQNGKVEMTDGELTFENYLCNASNQTDLVYASKKGLVGQAENNDLVALKFNHLLSKVQTQFTSNFPDNYEINITDVKISNICDKGNYSETAGWTDLESTDFNYVEIAMADDNRIAKDASEKCTSAVYVMPKTYDAEDETNKAVITFKLALYLKDTTTKVWEKELTGVFAPEWVAGHVYSYNISLSGSEAGLEEIEFTTDESGAVTDWVTDSSTVDITWKNE